MYIINNKTNYLLFDGKKTIINENKKDKYFFGNCLEEILNESCIYYGSTLDGRIKAAKNLISSRYKLPIIISEKNNLIFFQIKNKNEIIWFNFNRINDFNKNDKDIKIFFKDNYCKKFSISWSIFNNQILKSSRLIYVFSIRGNN